MGNKEKWLRELKRSMKRREERPVATYVSPAGLKVKPALERRMAHDHLDVLQNIDFTLVAAYRAGDDVDDGVVEAALRAVIQGIEPSDPRAVSLVESLTATREMRADVSDSLWTDALRVVYTSVRRHSRCEAGDTDYLCFAAEFVR